VETTPTVLFFFVASWGGVRLGPQYVSHCWSIVPVYVGDVWSSRWNENWQGKQKQFTTNLRCGLLLLVTNNTRRLSLWTCY
jgi:hypothetical protein